MVHVISSAEQRKPEMSSSNVKNVTESFLSIAFAKKSCGLVPSPNEWKKPVCKQGVGCDVPLNCFNYTRLTGNGTKRTLEVTPHKLELILENPSYTNICAVVMFYAPWCPYSVEFARRFNALGRSFRELPVLALDFTANDP